MALDGLFFFTAALSSPHFIIFRVSDIRVPSDFTDFFFLYSPLQSLLNPPPSYQALS